MFGNMGVDTTLHQSMNPPISWVPMMILLMNARQGKGGNDFRNNFVTILQSKILFRSRYFC